MATEPLPSTDHPITADAVAGLQRHLRTRLSCDEDARDITQEACLKLLLFSRKTNDIRDPKAYLYQIARHLLYRHYIGRDRAQQAADIDVDAIHSADSSVEALTAEALRRQRVNEAWQELPTKCQRVLILRWREGLQVAEIAAQMQLSRAMVKKYLAKGLAHFRKRLRQYVLADQRAD